MELAQEFPTLARLGEDLAEAFAREQLAEDVETVRDTLELARQPLTTLQVCVDSGFDHDLLSDGGIGRTLAALERALQLGQVRRVPAGVGELWDRA